MLVWDQEVAGSNPVAPTTDASQETTSCEAFSFAGSGFATTSGDKCSFAASKFQLGDQVGIVGQSLPSQFNRGIKIIERQRRGLSCPAFRPNVFGVRFHGLWPKLGERSPASNMQELDQFGFGHGAALSAAVALLVSFDNVTQWIG